MGEEGSVMFGLRVTALKVTEDLQIQVSLWLHETEAPSQVTGLWELGTRKAAAEARRKDDANVQIRGSMAEREGILTDKNQSKKYMAT